MMRFPQFLCRTQLDITKEIHLGSFFPNLNLKTSRKKKTKVSTINGET